MGHRAGRRRALQLHQDCGRLGMSNPDRQELVSFGRLQQHDRLLADEVEAHAVDVHLLHRDGLALMLAQAPPLKPLAAASRRPRVQQEW